MPQAARRSRCRPPSAQAIEGVLRPATAAAPSAPHEPGAAGSAACLKNTFSSTSRMSSMATSNRSRQASISSSTSTSGAEAPALIADSRPTPSSSAPVDVAACSISSARGQPACRADLDQAARVRRVRRTDDQQADRRAARSPRRRAGGSSWRSRCPRRAAPRCAGKRRLSAATMSLGVAHRERGLGGVGEPLAGRAPRCSRRRLDALDQEHRARRPPGPWCRPPRDGRHGRSAAPSGRSGRAARPRDGPC